MTKRKKISKKMREEVEFLGDFHKFVPTEEEIKEYIDIVSRGKGNFDIKNSKNRLILARRGFDITFKMWRKDIEEGILFSWEILEEWEKFPYIKRVFKRLGYYED